MMIMTKWLLLTLSGFLIVGCTSENESEMERQKRIIASKQYRDGKFANPDDIAIRVFSKETWEMLKRYILVKRIDPKPEGNLPVTPIQAKDWGKRNHQGLSFAWLGHSSLLIEADGTLILVDPVFEKRTSPFSWIGPERFHSSPVQIDTLPNLEVVLITHDHYDHLEEPTIRKLKQKVEYFLVPLGIGRLLEKWGIAADKIVEIDWWEKHSIGTLTFTATPTVHYSGRWLFDGNKRLWCSWSVLGKNQSFFVSGDSGYHDGFKTVGERMGPFDVTFLKIGAYDETWKRIHMTPEEAVQQHQDLKGRLLVPLHWATFDLGLHSWYEPIERLQAEAKSKRVKLLTPEIGANTDIAKSLPTNPWWREFVNSESLDINEPIN